MGTRALISINGKPMIATHWDGYPSALGSGLLQCDKTFGAVIRVAERHTIDRADSSIREDLNRKRVEELSKKHGLSEQEIRNGKRRGPLITADDYEICDINHYRDWAEYQYDIRGKDVFFRPLRGQYPESLEKALEFERLTREVVENEIER
jgi:hypothetical protein